MEEQAKVIAALLGIVEKGEITALTVDCVSELKPKGLQSNNSWRKGEQQRQNVMQKDAFAVLWDAISLV